MQVWNQTNPSKLGFHLSRILTIYKMNRMLYGDDVPVVVLIVFPGEFQCRLRGVSDVISMHVMVQGIRPYTPTPTLTEPPLKSILNVTYPVR